MNGATEKHHAHDSSNGCQIRRLSLPSASWNSLLLDPIARAVAAAPPDDEPVTEQDRRRLYTGQSWFCATRWQGDPGWKEVLAEFGLKPADSRRKTPSNAALPHRVAR